MEIENVACAAEVRCVILLVRGEDVVRLLCTSARNRETYL